MYFNILSALKEKLIQCLKENFPNEYESVSLERLVIEKPKNPAKASAKSNDFGDLSLNWGFVLGKQFKKSPMDIAQIIGKHLEELDFVKKIEVISGFINIFLSEDYLMSVLNEVSGQEEMYCKNIFKEEQNYKVNFEYASINPTGPMHAGHLRAILLADTLVRILKYSGYDVDREYYINDTGGQAKKLVEAVYYRYQELFGVAQGDIGEYPGEYIIDIAKKIKETDRDKWLDADYYEHFRQFAVNYLLQEIKVDLASLNISHDEYFSEHKMMMNAQEIDETIDILKQKDLIDYEVPPETSNQKFHQEEDKKTVMVLKLDESLNKAFKVLQKQDGTHTYLMADLVYHINKYKRGYNWLINYFGADHSEHAQVLITTLKKINPDIRFDIKTCQMVKFEKGGEEFKLSKRAGNYITSKDVVTSTGADIVRVNIVSRKNDSHLILDVDKLLKVDENNPIFYLQYAHVRCVSALDKDVVQESALSEFIVNKKIREMAVSMIFWPKMLSDCINNLDPQILYNYLLDFSMMFHSIWGEGKDSDIMKLANKHFFVRSVKNILYIGIKLLGVKALNQMNKDNY